MKIILWFALALGILFVVPVIDFAMSGSDVMEDCQNAYTVRTCFVVLNR